MDYTQEVRAALDRLGVPVDDSWDTIAGAAIARIGAKRVNEWEAAPAADRTRTVLGDADIAVTLGLGYRRSSLEREVPWILETLQSHIGASGESILDIGSGTGFTASLIAATTGAEVIATDVVPEALATMTDIADRLGAKISPSLSPLEDLGTLVGNQPVTQIVCQKVMGHLQVRHEHNPGFSWITAVQRQFENSELAGTALENLFTASPHVDQVLVIDGSCPERWAALVSVAYRHGFAADLERSRPLSSSNWMGHEAAHGFAFVRTVSPQLPAPEDLLLEIAGEDHWHGDEVHDVLAEMTRLGFPQMSEKFIRYRPHDGVTLRFEVIDAEGAGVLYGTASNGDRFLKVFPLGTSDARGYVDLFNLPDEGISVEEVDSFAD